MECHDAQEAISLALDGETPDAAALEAAKQHCRDCAECGAFVRALNVVKRAPLPEPAADLPDRVMAAVRREGARAARPQPEPANAAPIPIAARRRPRPAALAAWIGVAAVLIASAGGITVVGVRMLSQGTEGAGSARTTAGVASAPSAAESADMAAPPATEDATHGAEKGAVIGVEPSCVAFNGIAYRLIGPSTLAKEQLKVVGMTKTSLAGGAMQTRDVLGTTGVPEVYLINDAGELLAFAPIERKFAQRSYRLSSGAIDAFGVWPVLPPGIAPPTSPDGSPTFTAVGADPSGVTIYRKTTSNVAEGIAVAPGSPTDDPASGSPNWTWWTPAP